MPVFKTVEVRDSTLAVSAQVDRAFTGELNPYYTIRLDVSTAANHLHYNAGVSKALGYHKNFLVSFNVVGDTVQESTVAFDEELLTELRNTLQSHWDAGDFANIVFNGYSRFYARWIAQKQRNLNYALMMLKRSQTAVEEALAESFEFHNRYEDFLSYEGKTPALSQQKFEDLWAWAWSGKMTE